MTNGEKYLTAKERAEAFQRFLKFDLDVMVAPIVSEAFRWLDLEAPAEEPLPCPFCGGSVETFPLSNTVMVHCIYCSYQSKQYGTRHEAIAAHNRVARAAKEKAEK